MPHERKDDELGALWLRTGRQGEYLSGTINGVKVIAFWNERATAENQQPHWRVKRALSPEERDRIANERR